MTLRVALGGAATADPVPINDIRVGFRAAYVLELLDDRTPEQALATHVLVLNPRSYSLSEPFAVTLTPTEANSVVSEENGQIIREISLEGTYGFAVKTAPTFRGTGGQDIGGVTQGGNLHFQALRNFFRKYSGLKKNPRDAGHVTMHFHSLKDDDHFIVVPRMFETPRDARTTRVHYSYRMSLAAVANSDQRITEANDPFGLGDPLRTISEAFNDARAAFSEITSEISQLKRKVGNITAVMINVAGFLNSVGNFVRSTSDLIDFSFKQAVAVVDVLDNAAFRLADSLQDATLGAPGRSLQQMRRLQASIDRMLAFPDRFTSAAQSRIDDVKKLFEGQRNLTADDLADGTAGATFSTSTQLALGSESSAGIDLGEIRGFRTEEVLRSDTIDILAARVGSNPLTIILLNDLRFPFFCEGGGPGCAAPGDEVLVPVEGTARDDSDGGLTAGDEYLTPEEALYGRDIALDLEVLENEQRLEFKEDLVHGALDADTVTGLNNVVQGIRITVATERGSTVFIPDVGIRRTAGKRGTLAQLVLAALNLREAILQDSRIESIQDSTVVLDGDVLTQEITPIVRGQRDALTVVLPFGRASGGGA